MSGRPPRGAVSLSKPIRPPSTAKPPRAWTNEDKKFIRTWRHHQAIHDLAFAVEMSYSAVRRFCQRENLKGPKHRNYRALDLAE